MDKSKQKLNLKNTIKYICSIFKFFGIKYMAPEDFRLAKFNKHPEPQKLVLLCFHLIQLEISNFRICPVPLISFQDLSMKSHLHQIQLFVMHYLDTNNSPFVKKIENDLKVVDFGSSRNVILMVAWLMSEIDLFVKFDQYKLKNVKSEV